MSDNRRIGKGHSEAVGSVWKIGRSGETADGDQSDPSRSSEPKTYCPKNHRIPSRKAATSVATHS